MTDHNVAGSEKGGMAFRAGAFISRDAQVQETILARGIFAVELLRPKPGMEDKYESLWTRFHGMRRNAFMDCRPLTVEEWEEKSELEIKMWPMVDVLWRDLAPNTVCTAGKNLALDTFLAGSSYTVVGPYLGLISSTSYSATAAGDTQASHSGWLEAGNANAPTYTSPRKTAAWSAASAGAKALSAALAFAITGTGTVKGAFLVYGTGALSTIDNTAGVLMSAGVFSGGDKIVANLDTLNVSYSLTF